MNPALHLGLKVAAAAGLAALAAVLLIVFPAQRVLHLRAQVKQEIQELISSAELLQEFKDPAGALQAWEQRLQNLDQRFPKEQALGAMVQQLGDKTRELGIEILSSTPVAEASAEGTSLPLRNGMEKRRMLLEIRCDYRQLGIFLADIPQLTTFFSVDGMDIIPAQKGGGLLDVKLTLGFYVSKDAA